MSYMSALGEEAARSADARAPGRFEVDYLAPEGAVRGAVLEDVWSAVFEDALPVRRFAARKGQQHLSGLWWSAATSKQSLQRHERSTAWFQLYRRGGRVILHHGHIRPVLVRDWSPEMDGIAATIWASQTTLPLGPPRPLNLTTP